MPVADWDCDFRASVSLSIFPHGVVLVISKINSYLLLG